MFQASDNFSIFSGSNMTSRSDSTFGSDSSYGFPMSKLNSYMEPMIPSERSLASLSGKTSQNGDSDADEIPFVIADSFSRSNDKSFFNLPSQSNLFQNIEDPLASRSSSNSSIGFEPSMSRQSFFHSASSKKQMVEAPQVPDRSQSSQFLLHRRSLMQEQARHQLNQDTGFMRGAPCYQPMHSQAPPAAPALRPVTVNEFYCPRQVNNAPVLPRNMISTHESQRIQSSHQSHAQPSPSALRFQQQMQQQIQSQAASISSMEGNYGGMMRKIFQVQFKCAIRYFTLAPGAPETLGNGDFVVVEADRGEDVGVVTEVMTMKTFVDRRILTKASNMDDEDSVIGKILRPATLVERQTLPEKFRTEESILLMCRELAYKTYRLPLQVHNVEYQFDRHKLTVYYSSDARVDFREFVRDLFAAYKARIWMKKIDVTRPMDFQQSAAIALATGMQPAVDMMPSSSYYQQPQQYAAKPMSMPVPPANNGYGHLRQQQPSVSALNSLRAANGYAF